MDRQLEILQTLKPLVTTLAEASLASLGAVASQVWLVGPGDVCAGCPRRADCPDQARCLHLVGTAGDLDPATATPLRLPLGVGPIGALPSGHEALVAERDLDSLGVAEAAWLRGAGIRSVTALPLRHGQRGLGVLVVFEKSKPSDEQRQALAGSARLGAEAIGNVEAYRELAADRNRLAAKNARLRAGLGLPSEPEPAPAPVHPVAAAPIAAAPPTTVAEPSPPSPTPAAATPVATGAAPRSERFELPALRSFAQIQREGILHALERTGWRVSGPHGAAAALKLKPTTLESKMKKLGIRRPPR